MNRIHTFRQLTLAVILTITLFTAAHAGELSAPVGHLLGSHNESPSLAVADFNRDGKLDVVKAGVELNLAFGNGAGGFTNSTAQIFGGYSPRSVIAPDLNADGNADLVMLTREQRESFYHVVWVMLGNGNGTFQQRQIYYLFDGGHAERVQVTDLDMDGRRDDLVLTGRLQEQVETMIGNNDGTFNPAVRTSGALRLGNNSAFGDFNSDGKTDMAMSRDFNGRGFPMWIAGNGNGTFDSTNYSMLPIQDENRYEVPVAGDFNSDGKTDVAFVCEGVALQIFYARGDGTFEVATVLPLSDVEFPTEARTADMDGNGLLDIVVITAVQIDDTPVSTIAVFTNHASGWGKKIYAPDAGDLLGALAVRDFTNDGKNDILYAPHDYDHGSQHHFSHRIRLMKNAASTTTTALTSTVPNNTTTQGDPVTFTAAISAASPRTFGKPFGAITFRVNGTPLCAMFPNANGGGTCGTAELPVGTHQITVTFDGDASFGASNSNTIAHTVNPRPQLPTTTTITSNDPDNRTTLGEAVIFTASVTANNGGTPTGNVVFKDNGTAWCAKPLVNGAVNCGTTELTVGSHNMTVEYQGGTGFAPSTSGTLVHIVNLPPTQTSTLAALADAYVKGATPDASFGTGADLQVKRTFNPGAGKGRNAYLRFDTSGVVANRTLTRVRLRLFGKLNQAIGANQNIPCGVFGVPTDFAWTENTLTWNNRPRPNPPFNFGEAVVTDATARWYEWDITNYIKEQRAAGKTVVVLLLRNMTAGANGDYYTTFNSREATSNQPQLVVEHY